MPCPTVQRFLIRYLKAEAPLTFADATAVLRANYSAKMEAAASRDEQHIISGQYRKARTAMVIRLAAIVSSTR